MELHTIIGLLVILSLPLNLYVIRRMFKESKAIPRNKVLKHDIVVAGCVILFIIVYGSIFVNNDQAVPPLSLAATKIITRVVALVIAYAPAGVWAWMYRGGK
jgi:hypothetical protein